MRHGDKINNLGKKTAHRKAMLSNMTCSLIEHKRITTTLAKAKALRVYAEPLITRAKADSMHNRRIVFSYLQDKEAITELFTTVGDKVANRPGGYTRIIKLPRRLGDAADMALVELVDFNEVYTKDGADTSAKKTRRSRRSGGAKAGAATAQPKPAAEEVADVQAGDTAEETTAAETPATNDAQAPAADDHANNGENNV
jgi:large subunit ribosomal protein L17